MHRAILIALTAVFSLVASSPAVSWACEDGKCKYDKKGQCACSKKKNKHHKCKDGLCKHAKKAAEGADNQVKPDSKDAPAE